LIDSIEIFQFLKKIFRNKEMNRKKKTLLDYKSSRLRERTILEKLLKNHFYGVE